MENKIISQAEKAHLFKALHERPGCFAIPNPWDAGTAKILTAMGFEALATTSAGLAFSLGERDGSDKITLEETLANGRSIVSATHLPVSCDLQNCFSSSPEGVGETIKLAADAGLAGGSIEDFTGNEDDPIYNITLAEERVRAAAEAAKSLPFPFLVTARCENFLHNRFDLKDTIIRLQRYQDAGAHVLFAPGLKTKQDILTVINNIDRPLNVILGLGTDDLSLPELADLGVKRVSIGSALCRVAFDAFMKAAAEIKANGTLHFAETAVSYQALNDMFQTG